MKAPFKIRIVALPIALIFLSLTNGDIVPNKECAVKIAKVVTESKLNYTIDNLKDYHVELINDSIWRVTISPKSSSAYISPDSVLTLTTGGVIYMEINKHNCLISNLMILK